MHDLGKTVDCRLNRPRTTDHYFDMRALRFLIFGLFFLPAVLSGQSLRAYEKAGDEAFKRKDYGAAVQHYATVLKRDVHNTGVFWKYAECAHLFYALPEAEKSYLAVEADEKKRGDFPLLYYRLGEVKKAQGDYPNALKYFEQFLEVPAKADPVFVDKAKSEVEHCRWALTEMTKTPEWTIAHPGKEINSPYSDFGAVPRGDTIFYSSYRFDKKGDKSVPKRKTTKLLTSIGGKRSKEAGRGFPAGDSTHVAHLTFTAEGVFMFYTLCKNVNETDIRCEIWMMVKDIRGRWSKPARLPETVNMPGYTATQPNVGVDTVTKQPYLYFASDRPGGKGKMDLWQVPLDTLWFCPCNKPVNGQKPLRLPTFKPPVNLTAINTAENDATPFFHTPAQTLYFSSEGGCGFGGYDIFKSAYTSGRYNAPENAGYGLNSSYNDLYFSLKPDGDYGYLSSNRPGSFYLDESNKACCNDIFTAERIKPKELTPPAGNVPGVAGKVPGTDRPISTRPIPQLPTPEDEPNELQDFVGLPLYFDNDEPDKRTQRTFTKKSYDETVFPYLERQEEYREKFAEGLNGVKREEAENLIDIFFDYEVRRGYERLTQLCELLQTRLQDKETVEVIIKGFTSPRAQSDYNINLGKRRISSVRNQFEKYDGGALKPYIDSGQLKISEASFGETTVRTGISDKLEDERNSVYHPDASRERRVEIVEIREKK